MGRKGKFEGSAFEWKEDLKEVEGTEGFREEYRKERKVWRRPMGRQILFEGRVWERKEGLMEEYGK